MKKCFKRIFMVTALCTSLTISGFAGEIFKNTKEYKNGDFLDIDSSKWYYSEVISAYNLGFMNGIGENAFSPDGIVSVAQGITIASRINNIYEGGDGLFNQGDIWYKVYVDYAITKGFLKDGAFDDYNRPIKRNEMATILANALPKECFNPINSVESIPDVSKNQPYYEKLLMLYNAGIVMGSDDYGTFKPDTNLTRSEISAMINRIALSKNRIKKTLLKKNSISYGDAYHIIDEISFTGKVGIPAGWLYDNRGSLFTTLNRYPAQILDMVDDGEYSYFKRFVPETAGLMTLDAAFNITQSDDGAYFSFNDSEEKEALRINLRKGTMYLTGESEKVVLENFTEGNYVFKILMNLDTNSASIMINGKNSGSVNMSAHKDISKITFGTTKEGKISLEPIMVGLHMNYPVFDAFLTGKETTSPEDYETIGEFKLKKTEGNRAYDVFSMHTLATANKLSKATKRFSAIEGNVVFESLILLPNGVSGAFVSLNNGENEIVKIQTTGNKFVLQNGTVLRTYMSNIWQTLRIEANTQTQKALIRIDGKTIGTYDFAQYSDFFDNISIGINPSENAEMWFDDVMVCNLVEHDDYVPTPIVAESTNYNVGIHTCNLWRGSNSGEGWDSVSPFEELTPYLEYYDEGLIELADWETKWMVEHGIDFQHLCWYSPSGDLQAPIKKSNLNDQLHDGFFNSKYSDLLDFCFMWENSGKNINSIEQFKEILWPYWVEYYFTDPRYLVLDNMPVMTVWSYGKYVEAFGSVEKAAEATDFMKNSAKQLGYDGFILLFADGHQMTEGFFKNVSELRADGTYGYHWNRTGKDASHQIYRMSTQQNINIIHNVPTVSVGFNDIGRNDIRSDLITLEGHKEVCEYIRDIYLPHYKTNSWKDKTLFVSTWNEYSEGTYVMPSSIHGFGYLENIRNTFTKAEKHTDLMPTKEQIARVTHMYSKDHTPIRWLKFEEEIKDEVLPNFETILKWDMSKLNDAEKWINQFGMSTFSNTNGVLSGTGNSGDFAIKTTLEKPLNINFNTYLHIKLKTATKDANFEVFFITDSDKEWNNQKYIRTKLKAANEFVDYYVDMGTNPNWRNNLLEIRIDPMNVAGNFEIALIEILKPIVADDNSLKVLSNMTNMEFDFKPIKTEDGDILVTADPQKAFFSMLGLYHEYSRFTGKLIMKSRSHSIELNVNSDKMIVDGKEQDLGYKFYLKDGLPVLPIKKITETFGYKSEWIDNKFSIYTLSEEYIEILKKRKPFEWEFIINGDNENWTPQNCIMSVFDGKITGEARKNNNGALDPAIMSPNISLSARDYTKVIVGMSYDITGTFNPKEIIQIFFKTGTDLNYTGEKNVAMLLGATKPSTDGKVVEYVIDMTENKLWGGYITGIRVDPFNNQGIFKIDYVRFSK